MKASIIGVLASLTIFVAGSVSAGTIEGVIKSKKKRYIPGTVVYVKSVAKKYPAPKKPVRMDQKGSKFLPTILPVLKGTTIEYLNSDPTIHNVYSPDGEKFDLGNWGEGDSKKHTFDKEGAYTHLCKLHPTMMAHVIVLQNPFFAVVSKDGKFKIKGVPAGKHKLAVWNQRRKADILEIDTGKNLSGITVKLKRR
jgi:plastocyanin